jgi:hypothetical protein
VDWLLDFTSEAADIVGMVAALQPQEAHGDVTLDLAPLFDTMREKIQPEELLLADGV